MNINKLVVPGDVRYISDWKDLKELLPTDTHYIMNKTITGCGYTEYYIRNDENVIICSPRKILLENKNGQHQDMENLLYLKDEYSTFQSFDKDITKEDKSAIKDNKTDSDSPMIVQKAKEYSEMLKLKILKHRTTCGIKGVPCKFLVTYDSFRRIKEALGVSINCFTVVVDEFQSLFCDARFKSDTENSFLRSLQDIKRVVYLSATPMMVNYLKELDEFKDLPYYELDWKTKNPDRVITPFLETKPCYRGILEEVSKIVSSYKEGNFKKLTRRLDDGTFEEVYSKEAVIYVNSVKNICDIIRKCELTIENTNVLCAGDSTNRRKVRTAFKKVDSTLDKGTEVLGSVPKKGEPHKMFTLCTRTVYLGADFYSTNARSFIFSDANVDCLSVDITLDLPQILGRQRLEENPWKNRAELYYKTNTKEIPQDKFRELLNSKIERTNKLLSGFDKLTPSERHEFAEQSRLAAKMTNYKYNYLAVDEHAGSDLKPVFNKLMMISEMRSFEIQQYDYKDRFSVFNALVNSGNIVEDISLIISEIYNQKRPADKYRYLCSLPQETAIRCLSNLPESFSNYYTVLGAERIKALGYNITDMKKEYEKIIGNQGIDLSTFIQSEFKVGEKIPKNIIKERLKKLYDSIGYSKTPKAVDLGDYFIIKTVDIKNESTGKRDKGYEILSIKE